MACALTQGFVLDCRDYVGGVKAIHIIEFANVTSVAVTAGVTTSIVKATGKAFYKYNLIKQTAMAEEAVQVSEENGTVVVDQSIKFPMNKLQAAVRNEITLLAKNLLMMVVIDGQGNGWLYGQTNGMVLKSGSKAQTGTKMSDRNGYELEFEGHEPALAISVGSADLAALQTVGP